MKKQRKRRLISLFLRQILLLGIVGLFLTGCGQKGILFSDVYTVFPDTNQILHKYNILGETLTPLCPDPVCDHHEHCLFTASYMQCTIPDGVCFVKGGEIYEDEQTQEMVLPETIYRYEQKNGKTEALCTVTGTRYEGLQGRLIADEHWVYYSVRSADAENETYTLWRISQTGGKPESMNLITTWPVSAVWEGYAWVADTSGIQRVHLKKRTVETCLENAPGVKTAIFQQTEQGIYCMEYSQNHTAVLRIQKNGIISRLAEGENFGYMQVSGEVLCYSVGDELYQINSIDGTGKEQLYTPAEGERLLHLKSCGYGFVAVYLKNENNEQALAFPVRN